MNEYRSLAKLSSLEGISVRTEMLEGKKYLVVPVIALVEGVHNGFYYSPQEMQRSAPGWNGVPLSIHHPQQGNQAVSANSPEIRETQTIGWLFNVIYENGKLKGEAWIDEEKCRRLAPEVLSHINSGRRLEVSTGLWSDATGESGSWNNENYSGAIINMIPDHLALLPGSEGACNWDDGCGIRANEEKGEGEMPEETLSFDFVTNPYPNEHACRLRSPRDFQSDSFRRVTRRHNGKSYSVIMGRLTGESSMTEQAYRYPKSLWTAAQARSHCSSHDGRFEAAIANKESGSLEEALTHINSVIEMSAKEMESLKVEILEVSQTEVAGTIQRMLDGMDTTQPRQKYHFLRDVFDDYFIFSIREEGEEETFWKQTYSVNDESGEVEFIETPAQVRKQVNYIELSNENPNEERSDSSMDKDKKNKDQPCCPERVKALIANEKSKWTETDEEFLMGLSEELLEKLEPDLEEESAEEETSTEEETEKETEPMTMEEFQKSAPAEIREVLDEALEMREARKGKLIKSLLGCDRNIFTEAELKGKSLKDLEALSKLAALPTFEANSPKEEEPTTNEKDGNGVPEMPKIDWKAAAERK